MAGTNPRTLNGHRRRELRRRVLNEETHCGICRQPVDTTLPHGQPLSPEVDEILPVSLGGDPLARDNVRLTHRICNQKRGNGRNERNTAAQHAAQTIQPSPIW